MRFLWGRRPSAVDFLWRLEPSWPAMKSALRFVRHPLAHHRPLAGAAPTPAEVVGEIGLMLALHLAAAAAVTLSLRAFGL